MTELVFLVFVFATVMAVIVIVSRRTSITADTDLSRIHLRQLGQSHWTYASEWNGRQFTMVDDDLSSFGRTAHECVDGYRAARGTRHPGIALGWGVDQNDVFGAHGYWMDEPGNADLLQPIDFTTGFGWFRMSNVKAFSQYLSGRFYDAVFYSPMQWDVQPLLDELFESPWEYAATSAVPNPIWPSYCMSPAALYDVSVFGGGAWTDPFDLEKGFAAPSLALARYPHLKTHVLEHSWLRSEPMGQAPAPRADGSCHLFNASLASTPQALFYDGHVETISVRQAVADDAVVTGGLWRRDTPFGPRGYFMEHAIDMDVAGGTSFHILTTDGIRGRDKLAD